MEGVKLVPCRYCRLLKYGCCKYPVAMTLEGAVIVHRSDKPGITHMSVGPKTFYELTTEALTPYYILKADQRERDAEKIKLENMHLRRELENAKSMLREKDRVYPGDIAEMRIPCRSDPGLHRSGSCERDINYSSSFLRAAKHPSIDDMRKESLERVLSRPMTTPPVPIYELDYTMCIGEAISSSPRLASPAATPPAITPTDISATTLSPSATPRLTPTDTSATTLSSPSAAALTDTNPAVMIPESTGGCARFIPRKQISGSYIRL